MIFIVRVSDSERLSNFHKIFINVKIFDSLKISDYEKAGSEVVSPVQSSCPTRSGIPRLPKFAILQDLKAPLSAAISSER